jgi:hypothetical protein
MGINNICHFVCSRFNIHLKEYLRRKKWDVTEDEWMDNHIDLLEMGLLQSLKKQTCKNFYYLCWFDSRTSSRHRDRIFGLKKEFVSFIPVYADLSSSKEVTLYDKFFQNVHKSYIKTFCKFASAMDKVVVQTRIDIDDYVHCTFVEEVQKNILDRFSNKFMSFYFPIGYHLNIRENNIVLWKIKDLFNQFPTISEVYNKDIKGIWDMGHGGWSALPNKVVINMQNPMWMWIGHDNNLSDRINHPWSVKPKHIMCQYDPAQLNKEFSFNEIYSKKLLNHL